MSFLPKKKSDRLPINVARSFILSDVTPFAIREAYKTARTNLVFSLASAERKIVVVTSCAPSEGKSTNCLNLAISMAETGASVLLIDSDMRKPMQHTLLELDNKSGLSSVLAGISNDISDVISKNVYTNLDVLTSGPIPPNPAELISCERMNQMLELVSKHYDYIFVDTPPVNVVTDALLYNGKTAGLLFIIKENFTTHAEISESLRRTALSDGKVLGFLKVACVPEKGGRGYSYKYKYKYEYKDYSYGK